MESISHKNLESISRLLINNNKVLGTAESCTGGWIAQALTSLAGSSVWFECGFVTYSNASKKRMLGVNEATLRDYGAVSEEVVIEMAEGVLQASDVSISVATSGIAGPGGGSDEKPVGTVWIAWAEQGKASRAEKFLFNGDREAVRKQAVSAAIEGILQNLSS